jgi:hypothetical protein
MKLPFRRGPRAARMDLWTVEAEKRHRPDRQDYRVRPIGIHISALGKRHGRHRMDLCPGCVRERQHVPSPCGIPRVQAIPGLRVCRTALWHARHAAKIFQDLPMSAREIAFNPYVSDQSANVGGGNGEAQDVVVERQLSPIKTRCDRTGYGRYSFGAQPRDETLFSEELPESIDDHREAAPVQRVSEGALPGARTLIGVREQSQASA